MVTLEQEFGQLLRRTPEYHGLKRKELGTALSRRVAIHLSSIKWVPDPILVSDNVLRSWLDQYEIPAGTSDIKVMAQLHKSMETFLELETWYGADLRKYVALGFTGRRALEEYLRRNGVRVKEAVVRAWHDKCSLYTPDELFDIYDGEKDEYVARPLATEADLRLCSCEIRKWYYHEGVAVPQIVRRLQRYPCFRSQDVTTKVVSHFVERNPPYEIDHWQQLLQDPFVEYLQLLKHNVYTIPDEDKEAGMKSHESYKFDWVESFHQSFFKRKLVERFCMSANFRAVDLHNVWQYICEFDEPHAAALPCCECGYVFPYSNFILDSRRRHCMGMHFLGHDGDVKQESGLSFVCEYCVADAGLCSRACIDSLRTRWISSGLHERAYWESRYPVAGPTFYAGDMSVWQPLRSKRFSMVGLERSLAALYGRRELARQADCPNRICTYPGQKSWQIHDELFYKQGYDLPCPESLTVAGRAKWSRILGSELSIDDLDSIMRDRRERRACRERQQLVLKYESQP